MAKRKRVEGDDTKLSDAFNSITADMSLHSTADKEGVKTIFRCHQAKLAASPILLAKVQAITSSNADVKPILYLEGAAETLSSILRLLYDGLRAMPNPAFTPIDLIVSIHIACEKYGIDSFIEPLNRTVLPLVSDLAPESALPLYLSAVKRDNASLRDASTKRSSQVPLEEWPADAMVGTTALQAMDLFMTIGPIMYGRKEDLTMDPKHTRGKAPLQKRSPAKKPDQRQRPKQAINTVLNGISIEHSTARTSSTIVVRKRSTARSRNAANAVLSGRSVD